MDEKNDLIGSCYGFNMYPKKRVRCHDDPCIHQLRLEKYQGTMIDLKHMVNKAHRTRVCKHGSNCSRVVRLLALYDPEFNGNYNRFEDYSHVHGERHPVDVTTEGYGSDGIAWRCEKCSTSNRKTVICQECGFKYDYKLFLKVRGFKLHHQKR